MTEPFIGQIQAFGFSFAPRGWALCQGQILPIAQNTALFSLLGTTYGGNGQTTFGLPDLRGRAALGQGQGPGLQIYPIGQKAGVENVTLTVAQMPTHNHPFIPSGGAGGVVKASSAPGAAPEPSATNPTLGAATDAGGGVSINLYNNNTPDITLNTGGGSGGGGGTVGINGASQPLGILNPYLTINYSIALLGIFPSRD
jgi:microcystin-dependent protein